MLALTHAPRNSTLNRLVSMVVAVSLPVCGRVLKVSKVKVFGVAST